MKICFPKPFRSSKRSALASDAKIWSKRHTIQPQGWAHERDDLIIMSAILLLEPEIR